MTSTPSAITSTFANATTELPTTDGWFVVVYFNDVDDCPEGTQLLLKVEDDYLLNGREDDGILSKEQLEAVVYRKIYITQLTKTQKEG